MENKVLDISVQKLDKSSIVSIIGSIDAFSADQITDRLNEQMSDGEKQLIIDLSGVDFMSSSGLRVILGALKETRLHGGDLYLAGAQAGVAKVLKISGFTDLLKTFENVDEAVAQFDA